MGGSMIAPSSPFANGPSVKPSSPRCTPASIPTTNCCAPTTTHTHCLVRRAGLTCAPTLCPPVKLGDNIVTLAGLDDRRILLTLSCRKLLTHCSDLSSARESTIVYPAKRPTWMPNTCSSDEKAHTSSSNHKSHWPSEQACKQAKAAHRQLPDTEILEFISQKDAYPEWQRRRKADHVRKGAICVMSVELQVRTAQPVELQAYKSHDQTLRPSLVRSAAGFGVSRGGRPEASPAASPCHVRCTRPQPALRPS